jgi:ABC-type transport system involved in multi-copper enzyme maturation permease subunit
MPVYDRTYRRWDGRLNRRAIRALPIVAAGIRSAFTTRSSWFWTLQMRGFMVASCLPTLLLFFANFLFWYRPAWLPSVTFEFFDIIAPYRAIQYPLLTRLNSLFLMIYCVLIGSGLIARDRATGALPLYLSRPLTLADYVMGKIGIIGWFMAMFTLVPNLLIWLVGVLADPTEGAWGAALPLLFPIIVQNLAVILTYSLTILAVSALCRRPMFAALIWFGLFILLPSFTSAIGTGRGLGALAAVSPNDALFAVGYQLYDIAGLADRALGEEQQGVRGVVEGVFEAMKFFASSTPVQAWTSVLAWCGLSLLVLVGVLRRQDVVVDAGAR